MLNSKELKENLINLFVENPDNNYVVGHGILTCMKIGFDENKLGAKKHEIASILQELGIDEAPLISLSCLMTLKSGAAWNQLQSLEDFQALELLLACSDACGFIHNDDDTIQRNIVEIGDLNSLLISSSARFMVNSIEDWLRLIRKKVIDKMYFITDSESIKKYANGDQKSSIEPSHKH